MIQRIILFLLMLSCPRGLAYADDWPQWQGPERTGLSKERGLLQSWPAAGPKLLWTFRDAGPGYSSMAIVGDRLYTMGSMLDKDCVFAIDLKNQRKIWSSEIGPFYSDEWGSGPRSTPTVDGNFLYAIGGYGELACVETSCGRKIWSQDLTTLSVDARESWSYCESPLVDGDQVVATPGGRKGAIAAFDKKTGTLKWRTTASPKRNGDYPFSSMIAIERDGVRQYVQATGGTVVGVRASDGKLLWSFPFDRVIDTPIYSNHCVYVSSKHGCRLIKLMPQGDQFKAEQVYASQEIRSDFSGVILVGEYVYGYSIHRGGCMCQDFKTGKILWRKVPGGGGMGEASVTYADGNLYYYHFNKGDVLLVKATPEDYREQGRFRIPKVTTLQGKGRIWTCPVVANGKLYLRDQDLIFCYDIRKPQ